MHILSLDSDGIDSTFSIWPSGWGVGGGDVIVDICMWNVFHSDGYGSPRGHHRLVYSFLREKRRAGLSC